VTIDVVDNDTGQLVYRGQTSREVGHHLDRATNRACTRLSRSFRSKRSANATDAGQAPRVSSSARNARAKRFRPAASVV
jgi:hypothetical protein